MSASDAWSARAVVELERLGIPAHRGPSVTWPTLFNQPVERVREWQRDGYLGVDMETAATLAVARRFGVAGMSMLVAWDEVLSGRSFLDPLPEGAGRSLQQGRGRGLRRRAGAARRRLILASGRPRRTAGASPSSIRLAKQYARLGAICGRGAHYPPLGADP